MSVAFICVWSWMIARHVAFFLLDAGFKHVRAFAVVFCEFTFGCVALQMLLCLMSSRHSTLIQLPVECNFLAIQCIVKSAHGSGSCFQIVISVDVPSHIFCSLDS